MAENSKIEWTDHTVNLWWGCNKVHTGCKNCYAEETANRFMPNLWGPNAKRKAIKAAFKDLKKYQRQAAKSKTYAKVFVGSMMDIFEDPMPLTQPFNGHETTDGLRRELFEMIDAGKLTNIIFLFLTKRPENIYKYIPPKWITGAPSNVWFGTSISDQPTAVYANRLSRYYLTGNLFLSIEPQVGPISYLDLTEIDWVIQGGESGSKKRPFDLEWAYSIRDLCKSKEVPYFFKQIDKVQPIPEDLMIRQFPNF